MKRTRLAFVSILLFAAATSGAAWAQYLHHGPRVRVYVGPAVGWSWYYPAPYYYYPPAYPPAVIAPSTPPAYIEQDPPPAPAPSSYWYYCSNPDGYYPYVKQCPGGWQRVAPQPPPQPSPNVRP